MGRGTRNIAAVIATTLAVLAAGAAPGDAAPAPWSLPVSDPAPGPAGCSVDIVNRELGSYSDGRLQFTYDLAGPSCRSGLYALVVLNTFNHRQVAIYVTRGDGQTSAVTFKGRLPFVPTPDPVKAAPPGSGLCVVGVTELQLSIADVAPNQPVGTQDPSSAPNCEPLFFSVPNGGARAFH